MANPSAWSFSLNREDILARKAARARIEAQIEELQEKLAAEDRWLQAVALILPPHLAADLFPPSASADGGERSSVWRRAVENVLNASSHGLLPKEVAQAIREGHDAEARERLAGNPNGVYNALARLVDEGAAKKHRDKFYAIPVFERLLNDGDLDDDADSALTGVNEFIVNFIAAHGPMPPKTVMEALRGTNAYSDKIAKNPQYGYSALARLLRQGHLIREGNIYKLPSKENGSASVPAPADPFAGLDPEARDLLG